MLYFLSFLLLFVSSTSVVLSDTIALNFNSLPSSQGWTYSTSGNSIPETDIFSVNNNTLYQDSLEVGYSASGYNCYIYYDVINNSLPFTISITAKVIKEGKDHPFGFAFGANFPISESIKKGVLIGLGTNNIKDSSGKTLSTLIDNTEFHNYLLDVNPKLGYSFYIDEVLIYTGSKDSFRDYSHDVGYNSYILLGDGTGSNNAQAEIKKYVFTQFDKCVDSDGDGVIDQWDNCPGTPLNSYVNNKGCPLIDNSALSGRILMKGQPLTDGNATLFQTGELFQKSPINNNGWYKFENVSEEKSINIMIRKPVE